MAERRPRAGQGRAARVRRRGAGRSPGTRAPSGGVRKIGHHNVVELPVEGLAGAGQGGAEPALVDQRAVARRRRCSRQDPRGCPVPQNLAHGDAAAGCTEPGPAVAAAFNVDQAKIAQLGHGLADVVVRRATASAMFWVVRRPPSGAAASTIRARRLTSAKALIFMTSRRGLVHPDGGLIGVGGELAEVPLAAGRVGRVRAGRRRRPTRPGVPRPRGWRPSPPRPA